MHMEKELQEDMVRKTQADAGCVILADLEQGTYQCLYRGENNETLVPVSRGLYRELIREACCGIYPVGDETATLEEYLHPVSIRRQMVPGVDMLQWEYADREAQLRRLHVLVRKRKEDIPVLISWFLQKGAGFPTGVRTLSAGKNPWPGAGMESDDNPDCLRQAAYSGKRVLVAEDNTLSRELAAELLRMTGAEVETAVNGKEALSLVAGAPANYYDLLLMDVRMPLMDGCAAARAIRSLDRHPAGEIPIIAMTSAGIKEDIAAAEGAGMDGHLTKPIVPARLREVLEQLLV